MVELLESLPTPNSWKGGIIVGFLGGISSYYFTKFIDERKSNKRKYADKEYKADLDRLVAEPRQEKIFLNLEIRLRLQGIEQLVQLCAISILSIFLAVMGYSGWILFPFLLLFSFSWFGLVFYSRAARRVERLLADFYSATPLCDEKEKKM